MIKSAVARVMWVGRATVFLVGLAVILALLFGVASTALGVNGKPFILGKANNTASKVTGLVKSGVGPALRLRVGSGPALSVNTSDKVANLNADQLDGQDSSQLVPTSTNSFLRNNTYRIESALGPGTQLGDGTHTMAASCSDGDVMLSGGPANLSGTTDMVESFPSGTNSWTARVDKNGLTDNYNVVVLCANQ
jgi:hypothetical protein